MPKINYSNLNELSIDDLTRSQSQLIKSSSIENQQEQQHQEPEQVQLNDIRDKHTDHELDEELLNEHKKLEVKSSIQSDDDNINEHVISSSNEHIDRYDKSNFHLVYARLTLA
jgi:hypothetical protein